MPSRVPQPALKNGKFWLLAGSGLVLVGLGVGGFYFQGPHPRSASEPDTGKTVNTGQSQLPQSAAAWPGSEVPKGALARTQVVTAVPDSAAQSLSAVNAVVQLPDHKTVALIPNALGLFPRVLLDKEQTVAIAVTYTDGDPGEVLVISAEDGGQVNGSIPVQTVKLDASRRVNFNFTTTRNEGVFRVTLRRAAEQQQFDFWVGPEPVLQTTTPTL